MTDTTSAAERDARCVTDWHTHWTTEPGSLPTCQPDSDGDDTAGVDWASDTIRNS